MDERLLREFISAVLLEEIDEKLLGEPDFIDGRGSEDEPDPDNTIKGSRHEQAVVSAIAGVTTPLGTGPTYPVPKRKKRKNRKK